MTAHPHMPSVAAGASGGSAPASHLTNASPSYPHTPCTCVSRVKLRGRRVRLQCSKLRCVTEGGQQAADSTSSSAWQQFLPDGCFGHKSEIRKQRPARIRRSPGGQAGLATQVMLANCSSMRSWPGADTRSRHASAPATLLPNSRSVSRCSLPRPCTGAGTAAAMHQRQHSSGLQPSNTNACHTAASPAWPQPLPPAIIDRCTHLL